MSSVEARNNATTINACAPSLLRRSISLVFLGSILLQGTNIAVAYLGPSIVPAPASPALHRESLRIGVLYAGGNAELRVAACKTAHDTRPLDAFFVSDIDDVEAMINQLDTQTLADIPRYRSPHGRTTISEAQVAARWGQELVRKGVARAITLVHCTDSDQYADIERGIRENTALAEGRLHHTFSLTTTTSTPDSLAASAVKALLFEAPGHVHPLHEWVYRARHR